MNRTYQDENSYWFCYLKDDEGNPNWRTEPKTVSAKLTSEDYQEVKEAMIKEIIQNSQDWRLEKEGDLTVVKNKLGRKHWKSDFSEGFKKGFKEEEWKKIENSLCVKGWKETPQQNPTSNQQAQQEHPPKEIEYMYIDRIYHRVDNNSKY